MDTKKYEKLNAVRQQLQGSLNYWKNAAHALTRGAEKASSGKQRETILLKIAYCQQHVNHAQERLNKIKEELTALDPAGSIARQIHSTQTNRDKTKREIERIRDTLAKVGQDDEKTAAYWSSRLEKQEGRLSVLEQRLTQFRASTPGDKPPKRHAPSADTLTILERLKQPVEEAEASFAKDRNPMNEQLDSQTVLTVIRGLQRNMIQAEQRSDERLADQLQASLQHLACVLDVSGVQIVLDALTHAAALTTDSKVKNRLHTTINSIEAMLDGEEPETLH